MPFSGGGFSGGGFGRSTGVGAPDPWAGATTGLSQQTNGVKQYGAVWASDNCPPCNVAIQQLQAALGVAADGKVGQGTADAVARLAQIAQQRGLVAEAFQLARVGNSPELVAKNADWLAPIVQRVTAQLNAVNAQTSPTVFPTVNGGAPTAIPTLPPTGLPPAAPGVQAYGAPSFLNQASLRAKLPYLIGAGILALGATAVYFIVTHPRSEEP